MKQVGKIRQPYQAQALSLISFCRFLARHYEDLTKEQKTATNVEPLEECVMEPQGCPTPADPICFLTSTCKETLAVLQVAAVSISTLRNFNMNAPEYARVDKAFAAARTKIQDCFNHFGVRIPCLPILPTQDRLVVPWHTVGVSLGSI
jgi:hypothetical protein